MTKKRFEINHKTISQFVQIIQIHNQKFKIKTMLGFINKIFGGSKSEKDVKKIQPLIKEINQHFDSYKSLSNDELRGKTQDFRDRIAKHLSDIDAQIIAKKAEAEGVEDMHEREAIYDEADKLEKKRNELLEEVLENILPEAFAVMKDTARRFQRKCRSGFYCY